MADMPSFRDVTAAQWKTFAVSALLQGGYSVGYILAALVY